MRSDSLVYRKNLYWATPYLSFRVTLSWLTTHSWRFINLWTMLDTKPGSMGTRKYILNVTHYGYWSSRFVHRPRFWISRILPRDVTILCLSKLHHNWRQFFVHDNHEYFEYLLGDPNYLGEEMFTMKKIGRH
jgi:hypothetical protein